MTDNSDIIPADEEKGASSASMTYMEHKGFKGSIEISAQDNVFHGKILGTRDMVTYEAESLGELEKAFIEAVEDYIETLNELGFKK